MAGPHTALNGNFQGRRQKQYGTESQKVDYKLQPGVQNGNSLADACLIQRVCWQMQQQRILLDVTDYKNAACFIHAFLFFFP